MAFPIIFKGKKKKKAEIKIKLMENHLAAVLESIIGNHWWKDKRGRYLGCNRMTAESIGLNSPNEIIGKTDLDMPWSNQATQLIENDKLVMSSRSKMTFEEYIENANTVMFLLTTKAPLFDENGNVVGVVGTSVDITELKNTQKELEKANKSKTEFVQNMQHDIRTPSAGLWGVLDILAKAETDPNKKKTLNMALTASKRLLDLCNDAVEFGDLSGNHRPQLAKPFDLRELARSVIELNKPAAFAKDLKFNFQIDSTVPVHVVSDEFRISRILINLLGNAIKFSHEGNIIFRIKAKLDGPNSRKGVLVIEIKDEGIGIPPDKINHVFEKFTRGVASNTNKYIGTGLGLYVVKTFVDELDGDILVESHENEGTYFKISLPFKVLWEDFQKTGLSINEHFESPLKESKQKRVALTPQIEKTIPFMHEILIIEDDKMCLYAEKSLLLRYVNKIDTAENVADAFKKLAAKRYDLVISDLGLPDGSGNDIVAHIKASPDALNYKTPFVAMTAHQDLEKHKLAIEAGFDCVGTKPLKTEKAMELLKNYPVQKEKMHPEEGLAVIDMALVMERIRASESVAIKALGILYETLQEDIKALKEAQEVNDIKRVQQIVDKIRGGLCYSGTPRLEEVFKLLDTEMKRTPQLKNITDMFSLVYQEIDLFRDKFKKLV